MTDNLIFALNAVGRLNSSFVHRHTYRRKIETKGKWKADMYFVEGGEQGPLVER